MLNRMLTGDDHGFTMKYRHRNNNKCNVTTSPRRPVNFKRPTSTAQNQLHRFMGQNRCDSGRFYTISRNKVVYTVAY